MVYREFDAPVTGGLLHAGRWSPESVGAPVVLLVHGVTATHRSWFAVAEAAPDLDLVAPDLRGRGGSRSLPGPAGMREHADDLDNESGRGQDATVEELARATLRRAPQRGGGVACT